MAAAPSAPAPAVYAITDKAAVKLLLHAAKYVAQPVFGILVGRVRVRHHVDARAGGPALGIQAAVPDAPPAVPSSSGPAASPKAKLAFHPGSVFELNSAPSDAALAADSRGADGGAAADADGRAAAGTHGAPSTDQTAMFVTVTDVFPVAHSPLIGPLAQAALEQVELYLETLDPTGSYCPDLHGDGADGRDDDGDARMGVDSAAARDADDADAIEAPLCVLGLYAANAESADKGIPLLADVVMPLIHRRLQAQFAQRRLADPAAGAEHAALFLLYDPQPPAVAGAPSAPAPASPGARRLAGEPAATRIAGLVTAHTATLAKPGVARPVAWHPVAPSRVSVSNRVRPLVAARLRAAAAASASATAPTGLASSPAAAAANPSHGDVADVVDFQSHLDNPARDWLTNPGVAAGGLADA